MAHKHSVYDSDSHFSINPITRALKNEASSKVSLVQYDHNSERFTFEVPRYIEGHDMSLCNEIRVHYINIDSKTKAQVSSVYEVEDMQISPAGEETVICSWLISRNATQLVGSLNFLIRFSCVTDGIVEYAWNTATYTGISISSGINADETFEEDYWDVIEQWKASVLAEFEAETTRIADETKAEVERFTNEMKDDVSEWEEAESAKVRAEMTAFGNQWNDTLDVERARITALEALKGTGNTHEQTFSGDGISGTITHNGTAAVVSLELNASSATLSNNSVEFECIPADLVPVAPVRLMHDMGTNIIVEITPASESNGLGKIVISSTITTQVSLNGRKCCGVYPLALVVNPEVQDIRVDYKGKTHDSAGEAVRNTAETLADVFGKVAKISPNLFDVDKGFTDGYRPANTIDISGGVEGFVPPLTNSYAGWKTWMGSILIDGGATICAPSNFISRIWCYPVIDGATTVNVAIVLTNANSTATADGTGMYWSIPTSYDRYILSVGTQSYNDLSRLMIVKGTEYPTEYMGYGETLVKGDIKLEQISDLDSLTLEQISDYEPYLNGNIVPIDNTKVRVEETKTKDGAIYIKWGWIHNYADEYGTSFTNVYNTLTSYQCVESPSGLLTNCLQIPSKKAVCYNKKTKTIEGVSSRAIDDKNHIILAQCNNGRLTKGYFMCYGNREYVENQEYSAKTDKDLFEFANRVIDKQTPNTLTFGFMTDSHVDFYNRDTYDVKLDYATKFANVPAYCQTKVLIHGGDILSTGYNDKTRPQETLSRYCAALNLNAKADLIVLKGNHDDNCYGTTTDGQLNVNKSVDSIIGQSEWFKRAMASGIANTGFVVDSNNPYGGYGYFDDEDSKIRIICLNTGEIPETLNDSGTEYEYNMYYLSAMSNAQLNFVANALKLEDKSDSSEWAVLFVSHIPLETVKQSGTIFGITDMKPRGTDVFFGIVNAYRDGVSYTNNSTDGQFSYNVSCSYDHPGEVVAFFCGHTHNDNTSNEVGGVGAVEYGYRYISIDSKAFANIVIDRTNRTINVLKFSGNNFVDPETDPYGTIVGLTADDVNEYGDWVCGY